MFQVNIASMILHDITAYIDKISIKISSFVKKKMYYALQYFVLQ